MSFQTKLVASACKSTGQDGAKEAMKTFAREKGFKTCNLCHSSLAPNYDLKGDGLQKFKDAGGQ